jgi:hypothetical protein
MCFATEWRWRRPAQAKWRGSLSRQAGSRRRRDLTTPFGPPEWLAFQYACRTASPARAHPREEFVIPARRSLSDPRLWYLSIA